MKYAELLTNILKDQSNIDKEALISQANDLKSFIKYWQKTSKGS